MVKKKKNRHQQDPRSPNGGDTSESCDDNQSNTSERKCCPHIPKAVDLTRVKKALAPSGIASECAECNKKVVINTTEAEELSLVSGLWLCLKCGHQGCGRDKNQHALNHYKTPHSELHNLAVNTEFWNIWCYECDLEISAAFKKKLLECVEFIKRQDCGRETQKKELVAKILPENVDPEESCSTENIKNTCNNASRNTTKNNSATVTNFPRLRGLTNLGNTCFFNAVLQCLAHTPFLLPILQQMSKPGTKFHLPGGTNILQESTQYLPSLEGKLNKWGVLTESLACTLAELQSTRAEVLNPSQLYTKFTKCCSQFNDHDQHDSHEFLRHLLEAVRAEDLKRYQRSILEQVGLSVKVDPTQVNESLHLKVKAYGWQASEMLLYPEQVFQGSLVSILQCQDCMHSTQRVETFLDLSLPVMADKPQPPVMRRKGSSDEVSDLFTTTKENQPSKHQLKKERRQSRKGNKKQKHVISLADGNSIITEEVTSEKNSEEFVAEQIDADVEDNVELDSGLQHSIHDIGESGYSSEKVNEDSTTESPTSQVMNSDSALASPASPVADDYTVLTSEAPHKELVVAIPYSCMGSVPPSLATKTSPMSPASTGGSPSPVSSEVNIELSPDSTTAQAGYGSPVSPSCMDDDRPISRFAFCPDDNVGSGHRLTTCSPVGEMCARDADILVHERDMINQCLSEFSTEIRHPPDMLQPMFMDASKENNNEHDSMDVNSKSNVKGTSVLLRNSSLGTLNLLAETTEILLKNSGVDTVHLLTETTVGPVRNDSPDTCSRTCLGGALEQEVVHDGEEDIPELIETESVVTGLEGGLKVLSASSSGDKSVDSLEENPSYAMGVLNKELEESSRDNEPEGKTVEHLGDGDLKPGSKLAEAELEGIAEGRGEKSEEHISKPEKMVETEIKSEDDKGAKKRKEMQGDGIEWSATVAPRHQCPDEERSIQSCLNQFTALELMAGNNKVGCANCTQRLNKGKEGKMVYTNSTKQLLVSSPPAVLILHLKRFHVFLGSFRKTCRHVNFPLVLDLASLCSAKCKDSVTVKRSQTQVLYSLYGVVEHSGHMHSGHYIAYVKVRAPVLKSDPRWAFLASQSGQERPEFEEKEGPGEPPPGLWYFVSDVRVYGVPEDKVLRSNAYLLFYERIW